MGSPPNRCSFSVTAVRSGSMDIRAAPPPGEDTMSKSAQGPPFAATRKALAETFAEIDGLLPGSVVVRLMRCGKRNCACNSDPPALHGPYTQWKRPAHNPDQRVPNVPPGEPHPFDFEQSHRLAGHRPCGSQTRAKGRDGSHPFVRTLSKLGVASGPGCHIGVCSSLTVRDVFFVRTSWDS